MEESLDGSAHRAYCEFDIVVYVSLWQQFIHVLGCALYCNCVSSQCCHIISQEMIIQLTAVYEETCEVSFFCYAM